MEYDVTKLRDNRYAVRPKGQLGTCGFYPVAWIVEYVNARNEAEAIRKAEIARRRLTATQWLGLFNSLKR